MSFEDDLKDVGDSIGKLVDNAVNSQDFQELNRKISDTINQFVYPNRKGPFRANGTQEPSRGYSADTSYSSQHSSHNNTAQQTGPHHYSYGPGGTMPGKSANPVPKPSHTWQTPQNTEWNSRIQERRVLRERFMPSTDLALVGGFQTAAGWGVTGTVPIMAGHSEVSFRRNGCVLPWLDRSMMASAPILTAESTFCISTS